MQHCDKTMSYYGGMKDHCGKQGVTGIIQVKQCDGTMENGTGSDHHEVKWGIVVEQLSTVMRQDTTWMEQWSIVIEQKAF